MGVIIKNNVMYNGGDTLIQPIIYSEEEREIGCWVDGKPLYQKTIYITLTTPISARTETTLQLTELPTADIEKYYCVSVIGGFYGTDTVVSTWAPFTFEANLDVSYARTVRQIGNSSITVWVGANYDNFPSVNSDNRFREFYITYQYTKTTDQPGSGIWTPQGTYAEHYSTNEQVVGTWIDGSTIYEKTLYYSSISTSKTDWIQLIQFDEADMLLSYNTRATWNNRQLDNAYLRISLYNGYLYHHEAELINGSTLSNYYATIRYTKSTSS